MFGIWFSSLLQAHLFALFTRWCLSERLFEDISFVSGLSAPFHLPISAAAHWYFRLLTKNFARWETISSPARASFLTKAFMTFLSGYKTGFVTKPSHSGLVYLFPLYNLQNHFRKILYQKLILNSGVPGKWFKAMAHTGVNPEISFVKFHLHNLLEGDF